MPREVFGAGFRVPGALGAAQLRGDRAPRAHRGRRSACARCASPAASRCCGASSSGSSRCSPPIEGIEEIALTTNGIALAARAARARTGGARRASTVSLDALEERLFQQISDTRLPLARVLEGIDAAQHAGLAPVKVNMVVRRGVNDHCVLAMAEHFRGRAADPALHRVHGRRREQRLARRAGRARRGDPRAHRRALAAASRSRREPRRRGRYALCLPRRRRRDRRDRLRHAALLRRLHARAPVRRRASCTRACSRARVTTCARCCAVARTTRRSRPRSSAVWGARSDRYSELRALALQRPRGQGRVAGPSPRPWRGAPAAHGWPHRDVLHRRLSVRRRRRSAKPRCPARRAPRAAAGRARARRARSCAA